MAERCEGSSILVVHNHLDQEIELVEGRIGSGARTVIAVMGPGYREIEGRGGSGYSYSVRRLETNRTVTATSRTRARDQRSVDPGFECR